MTTLTRALAKAMLNSLNNYKCVEEQVERNVASIKSVKSHMKLRKKLDESYVTLYSDWKFYREDTGLSEDEFNKVDDDVPAIKHNDGWFKEFQEGYYSLCDKSDDFLETEDGTSNGNTEENKESKYLESETQRKEDQQKRMGGLLLAQIEAETEAIKVAITKLEADVKGVTSGTLTSSRAMSMKACVKELNDRMNFGLQSSVMQCFPLIQKDEAELKNTLHIQFLTTNRSKLRDIVEVIEERVEVVKVAPLRATGGTVSESKPDFKQTYLKKCDPPKFDGEEVLYPDFKRKWIANVSAANLTAESELDRLRDNVPDKASKMLFGEETMGAAWSILDKMYGNKTIIASKLKNQLKSIKSVGKEDYDIVINLAIDVKTIEKRLKELNLEKMLKYDDEYLSAVFKALPSNERVRWLEFDKSNYEFQWDAMMVYLDKEREKSTDTKILISCYEDQSEEKLYCRKCSGSGHKKSYCPVKSNAVRANRVDSDDSSDDEDAAKSKKAREEEHRKRNRDMCGKCSICQKRHTFTKKRDGKEWPSDRFISCPQFQKMSVKDRGLQVEKVKGCSRCTSWSHSKADCRAPRGKCGLGKDGNKCQSEHSRLLCGSGVAYCGNLKMSVSSTSSSKSGGSEDDFPDLDAETLLCFQDVKLVGVEEEQGCCFDDGSNRCLIRREFAKNQNLKSQKVRYRLKAMGTGERVEETELFIFEVEDIDGIRTRMWAYGIDDIMPEPDETNLDPVRDLFPHVPDSAFKPQSRRQINLLIGNNFLSLHPSGGQGRNAVDNLRALHSNFGSGWVIVGAHPLLKPSSSKLSSMAVSMGRFNRIEVSPVLPDFWQGECLGVLPQKRCERCISCSSCSDPGLLHSRREEEDLETLKKGIKLVNGVLQVNYQFKKDPRSLPNNRAVAVKIAEKLEQKLEKENNREYYNQEFKKYLDRGAAIKISQEELDSWMGPINYISHHGVEQDSVSTPLRIVSNSSLKNGGKSLNDCLIAGPNSLNSMVDCMMRFRCYECGLVYDLTKAYNQLKTGLVERHLRRLVWRFSFEEPWQDFAFDTVAFGDIPAGNFLELGRDMVAELGRDVDPIAADRIIRDTYVDDGVSGGSYAEVQTMKGDKLGDGSFSGTLRQILDKGKLKMKVIVTTGETNDDLKHLIGNKVLGYKWNATTDEMGVGLPVNVTKKKNKKLRSGPNLTVESLKSLAGVNFSRRVCLGVTNGFLDFIGVACPFLLRFKLLMKELYMDKELKLGWDDLLPGGIKSQWVNLIAEAVQADAICFPRTTRPADAIGNPVVVSFGDGSFQAFCATVYIRWEVSCKHSDQSSCQGDFVSTLLCAKAKVTPQAGLTIPRSELSGNVLQSRLAMTTVRALQCEPSMCPTSVVMISDSECSISAIEKSTSSLKPFFHNRVSEILENMSIMRKYCPVEDIQHVAGDMNPADLGTRGTATVRDLGPGSYWQLGPSFLCLRRDLWPVTRLFLNRHDHAVDVPPEEIRTSRAVICALVRSTVLKKSSVVLPDLWTAIERILDLSNSIVKVKNVLARVIRCWKGSKDMKTASLDITAPELAEAERLMLVYSMVDTHAALEEGKLESLVPVKEGQIVVTRGRLGEECLQAHLGVSALPILMATTRAAYLYMTRAHTGEHGTEHKGIVETLARSRTSVWVHRGRDLAKRICRNCPLCIKEKKKLMGQQMALIKPERLVVCRPWTFVSLDFCGPFKIKGVVNARARKKCWVVVYVCCSTKAVCLLACCGYSTQAFLLRHEEFIARKGAPKLIISDRGSQLVSAGVIMASKESPENWDWSRVVRENSTTAWEFVPVGSQHRNGLPEATVKVLKRSLAHALHPGVVLSYDELVTLLARISYSINQRPLGLAKTSQNSLQEDQLMPLTPNMMMLGRNSNESPPMEYSEDERFCSRLAYVSTVEHEWWRKWVKEVMPSLLPMPKWKKEQANLKVGDVVHMWYEGNMKDEYRLAMVVEVFPDAKGLVRTVRVRYRRKNTREARETCRSKCIEEKVAVQRLQLIQSSGMYSEVEAESNLKNIDATNKVLDEKSRDNNKDLSENSSEKDERLIEQPSVEIKELYEEKKVLLKKKEAFDEE